MNILGLSAFFHESACCLLQDGRLIAAAAEERFSRRKHDPALPVSAFRFCLAQGGISLRDLDCVAYYEEPVAKLARQLWAAAQGSPATVEPAGRDAAAARHERPAGEEDPAAAAGELPPLDPLAAERSLREGLGLEAPIHTYPHHLSHAASAFLLSDFAEAAILTVDGVGEWATTTYGLGSGTRIQPFEEVSFPHSLGLLYSALTSYLGFEVNDGEYKVMGLAPYGRPRFVGELRRLLASGDGGQFRLDLRYFDFLRGCRMYSAALEDLFGAPARRRDERIGELHRDVAASLQWVLEELLLEKVAYLQRRTGASDLAMAGGVALNCVANGRILREGPFRRLFVQPAAGDDGGCLGAAALACVELLGRRPELPGAAAGRPARTGGGLRRVDLGPSWSADEVARLLAAAGLPARDFRGRTDELLEAVAELLAERRIVGWFQGRCEFGPRALGSRSLLADPRDPGARERLNRLVKKREEFRPFAPSVLAAHAAEHFELDHPSPFMLETCRVRSALDLPAITHVDGSARPQTVDPADLPRFAGLLAAFHRLTGCPLLVNTSFNVQGEPIVASPVDALLTMAVAGIDALALEDFLILATDLPATWPELAPLWRERALSGFAMSSGHPGSADSADSADSEHRAVSESLYTFV